MKEGRCIKLNKVFSLSQGYRVLVEDKDVKLPDGTVVESGLDFRNTFHLQSNRISSVFFVPCGGRPAAVSADNWQVC